MKLYKVTIRFREGGVLVIMSDDPRRVEARVEHVRRLFGDSEMEVKFDVA